MKLRQINENMIMQQLRGQLHGAGYFNRASIHSQQQNPIAGYDFGSRILGNTYLPTGVPNKARHQRFLGMERRLGAIRL